MLTALLATALAVVPVESQNAVPLRLSGRTVALTAAQQQVSCVSCTLVHPQLLGQKKSKAPPVEESYTPPPLLDSDPKTPPGGEVTPPPDVPSWQEPPPEQTPPPPPSSQNGVKYDMNAGQIVGKEVALGALALFLSDVVAGGIILGAVLIAVATSFSSSSSGLVVGALFVAVAGALLHLLLSPLWAALAVKASADEPTHNGLGGAALGAYGAAVGLGVIFFGISIALSLVASASGGTGTAGGDIFNGLGSVISLIALPIRWVGIPLAASWAMHRGPPPPMVVIAPHPRRPIVVSADGREARPVSGATVFAF